MTRHTLLPLTMGGAMGLMMLWTLHRQLTSDDAMGFAALAVFVGAHLLVVVVALVIPAWAATRLPRVHHFLTGLQRPSLHHIGVMLLGAVLTAFVAHLWLHGGLV